jgi:hypothetical protein
MEECEEDSDGVSDDDEGHEDVGGEESEGEVVWVEGVVVEGSENDEEGGEELEGDDAFEAEPAKDRTSEAVAFVAASSGEASIGGAKVEGAEDDEPEREEREESHHVSLVVESCGLEWQTGQPAAATVLPYPTDYTCLRVYKPSHLTTMGPSYSSDEYGVVFL